MSYSVRIATKQDISWMLPDLREAGELYGHDIYGGDEHSTEVLNKLIENHIIIVCEKDHDIPCGFIIAYSAIHPFNAKKKSLHQWVWYVKPEFRKTRVTYLLMKAYREVAESGFDMAFSSIHSMSGIKDSSLSRLGFEFKEKTYIWSGG